VERYLIKKSLLKSLQDYIEMKRLKKAEQKTKSDLLTFGGPTEASLSAKGYNPVNGAY
jgi:hypothetical protein